MRRAGPAAAAAAVMSLPFWLPSLVVALRMRIFTRINGDNGVPVPGPLVDVSHFKEVYSHPAANGRSRGADLSDLFWYWLAPGPEIHQEHIEPGPRYDEIARTTRRILARSKTEIDELTRRCIAWVIEAADIGTGRVVRLRDLMMPVWAEFSYELVFQRPCPPQARTLIVDNANDVVTALKECSLRHMDRRDRLTRYLVEQVAAGAVPHELPEFLSVEEKALYLQGVFFNTAVVQMSEAMTHVLMALAHQQEVQAKVVADPTDQRYLDNVIEETMRMYPLFGIAHRITSADITVGDSTIPRGSVLCFNYPEFHRAGFEEPDRFDPDRWEKLSPRQANHIPYGVTANRPCPAQGLAPVAIRSATRELLTRFSFHSSAEHTRSAPNRGPCLIAPRNSAYNPLRRYGQMGHMWATDRTENVWRSVAQLVLGSSMMLDARRKRLCANHFAALDG